MCLNDPPFAAVFPTSVILLPPCTSQSIPLSIFRFNYRSTAYMVKHGFYNFLNWFDERAWYPLGRIVGGTVYPGLMLTSGLIHHALDLLNIPVHIRDICVFLAPIFR